VRGRSQNRILGRGPRLEQFRAWETVTGLATEGGGVHRKIPRPLEAEFTEEAEMVDRYTKCVLTVIAAALVTIAVQQSIRPVTAQGGGCGIVVDQACWVRTDLRAPIAVEVIGR
jgi:hypothetical protein